MNEYIKFKVLPEGSPLEDMTAQKVGEIWYFYSNLNWTTTAIAGDDFIVEKESVSSGNTSSLDGDTFLKAMAIAQDPRLAKELLTKD